MAEATPQVGARVGYALAVSFCALTLLAAIWAGPAAASSGVSMAARINGTNVARSTQDQPVNLSPDHPASVALAVTNTGGSRVIVRTVRVEGTVLGLTFFSYDTAVDLSVRPGSTASLRFALDTSALGGQAVGLIPGSVALLDANRDVVASQSMVTHVHGSIISVYGLFGLALLILTVLAFVDVLLAMARHRLSQNRWRRALRFLTPGIGFGLVFVFTLSALAVWIPSPGTWLVTVIVCAAVFFVAGYLSPTPAGPEDEEDEEDERDEGLLVEAGASTERGSAA